MDVHSHDRLQVEANQRSLQKQMASRHKQVIGDLSDQADNFRSANSTQDNETKLELYYIQSNLLPSL